MDAGRFLGGLPLDLGSDDDVPREIWGTVLEWSARVREGCLAGLANGAVGAEEGCVGRLGDGAVGAVVEILVGEVVVVAEEGVVEAGGIELEVVVLL